MSEEGIIHVSVEKPTQEEVEYLEEAIKEALEEYGIEKRVIVTDNKTSITDIPSLDDYVDSVADEVEERLEDKINPYDGAWHGVVGPDGERTDHKKL